MPPVDITRFGELPPDASGPAELELPDPSNPWKFEQPGERRPPSRYTPSSRPAILSSSPDPTTAMLPPPAPHFPISPPQPQPPHHHCANFNPSSATRHHTRVFHTRCAERVRLRHLPRVAGGESLLHAAQVTKRLRRVQFERAVAAGPWEALLGNAAAAAELGIRERWVLASDAVSWVSMPLGAAAAGDGGGGGSRCIERGNRGYAEDGDGNGGLRWWTGRFASEMWKVCKQAGETAFPHGI
ncbi:hypothetical protein DL767_001773 [Monosporascus sp. MG133]|nr:hypothetical protein DL767_001773 [Monosporascus sp. MG133]